MSYKDILDVPEDILEIINDIRKGKEVKESHMPDDEILYDKKDHDAETADDLDVEEEADTEADDEEVEYDEDSEVNEATYKKELDKLAGGKELSEEKMSRDAKVLIHHIENDREIYRKHWEKLQNKVMKSGKADLRKLKDDLQKVAIVGLTDYNDKMKDKDDINLDRNELDSVVDYLGDALEQMALISESNELPSDEKPICVDILKDSSRVGEGYRLMVSYTYSRPVIIPDIEMPAVSFPSQLMLIIPSELYDMTLQAVIRYQQSILPPADGEVVTDPDADPVPGDGENVEFTDTSVVNTGAESRDDMDIN